MFANVWGLLLGILEHQRWLETDVTTIVLELPLAICDDVKNKSYPVAGDFPLGSQGLVWLVHVMRQDGVALVVEFEEWDGLQG
jgi:hypothetical protein